MAPDCRSGTTPRSALPADAVEVDGCVQHRQPRELRLPAAVAPAVAGGVRWHRIAGPALRRDRRSLRMRLSSMGVYSTDSHANFVFLPPWRQPWPEVFDGTGLQVRNYAEIGAPCGCG